MELGASFSHPHLKYLGADLQEAIKEFKKLGLSWIRLGCYWNKIEHDRDKYNFSDLDTLINYCNREKLKVVLTVGMKAPRWPEYYLPSWLNFHPRRWSAIRKDDKEILESILKFIETCVLRYKGSPAVKIWQVENEPLDPSGEMHWKISADFLKEEVKLVRKLDTEKKVMINLWGNALSKRGLYKKAMVLADIIGLDIYLRYPGLFTKFIRRYSKPLDSLISMKNIIDGIKANGQEVWLAEMQAEPWEADSKTSNKDNPQSFIPEHLLSNLEYARLLKPEVTLLWGFEWWYFRKQKGDLRYWQEAEKLKLHYSC